MELEHLLEQYFEGRTSAAEEAILRRFFTSGDVPENLMMYKPLFVHFDNEIRKSHQKRPNKRKTFMLWISGVAACAAILAGSFFLVSKQTRCPGKGDYVVINGRCYTDAETIRSTMLKTLHEVSEDDEFLSDDKPANITNMIGNQLKEFDFLLDE
jgi:hypothetical protein